MSSVNGLGSAPTFEKYQGSEKLTDNRVEGISKNQVPQGIRGAGSRIGRERLDVDGKKSSASGKAQKADSFKEILKMLKGLLETLSAMIAKLSGSATTNSSSQSTPSQTASSGTGSTNSSSVKDSTNATVAGDANVSSASVNSGNEAAVSSTGSSTGSATGSDFPSTIETSTGTSSAQGTVISNDDLSVREESESTVVSSTSTTSTSNQKGEGLQALKDETGAVSVLTDDGFTIRADVKDQAWTISGPDGFATRIWGDPHVSESDGDTWDFLKQSTFLFGKNKVTVEVVPAGNGLTYSSRISVYSGDERVTISGIETNKPSIDAVARDGEKHDAQLSDGVIFTRGSNTRGESWSQTVDGKKDVMGH